MAHPPDRHGRAGDEFHVSREVPRTNPTAEAASQVGAQFGQIPYYYG